MSVNIRPEIQDIANKIIATRRDIHMHPELSFKELRTAQLVADQLNNLGISVKTGIGKTGVVGDLIGSENGPTIALRADMDALPIQETGDVTYKSVNATQIMLAHAQSICFEFNNETFFHALYLIFSLPAGHVKQSSFPPIKCLKAWQPNA